MMKKLCIICQKEFNKPYHCSKKDWSKRVLCSKECYSQWRPPIKRTCVECSALFIIKNYRKYTAYYCSKPCAYKGRINRNYPVNYAIRRRQIYMDWRKQVFERDNYTCRFCGIKNEKGLGKTVILHADHIKSLREIVNKYKLLTIEQMVSCDELWNIQNGRTLCEKCHKTTNTYGVNAWRNINLISA